MARFFLTLLISFLIILPSFSAIKGGVDYKIPIDYSKLNQTELETKADFYYNQALKTKTLDENTTSALNLYAILSDAFPENINYALRLGKIFDVIGKDRYAKGQYYRAMSINQTRPEPYYYLGDFYYEREQIRRALKYYLKAYENGYSTHAGTKEKINTIYQKLGYNKKI